MNIRSNPLLLASAGAPLALSAIVASDPTISDNVRKATGVTALLAGALYLYNGSPKAADVGIGAGAAWLVQRLGVL